MGQPLFIESEQHVPVPAQGHDHATLALLPFGIVGEERRFEPHTIAYQAIVDGKLRRLNVTLSPGAGVGLPTPADQTVFLALLQLAMRRGEHGARLTFQRQELLDILQWSDGGRNYDRMRESLQRLAQLTITVNSALISRDGRAYQASEQAMGIIDSYHVVARRGATCWVEWGHIVREAFRLGDLKRLDWDLVQTLNNPTTAQLYRLLDRVVLSGESVWEIGWKPLAQALGLSTNYSRPAEFRRVLAPHIASLTEQGVLDSYEYHRGGRFVFHVRNELRAALRRVLVELGVYAEAARQLVAAFDEPRIMRQCDHLQHGAHAVPETPGGWLTEAIRQDWALRYPDDDRDAFCALWEMCEPADRTAWHRAGLRLCDLGADLFATQDDPADWPLELRAVCRFMVCHGVSGE